MSICNLHINYTASNGRFSLTPFSESDPECDNTVFDVIGGVLDGLDVSCPAEGVIEALEDGSIWNDDAAIQSAIEDLHSFLLRRAEA